MQNSKFKIQIHISKIISLITIVFSFALCALRLPTRALAQSAGLAISPPVVEILLSSNKQIVQAFKLTNQGESNQFVANLHLVEPVGPDGQVQVDPVSFDPTAIPIIAKLANADLTLNDPFSIPAGTSTQLVLSLTSPATDITEDVYLALVITALNQTTNGTPPSAGLSTINHQPSSIPGLASLILVTIAPDDQLPVGLTLEGFDLPLLHDSMTPLPIHASLNNTTATMIRPGGTLSITPPIGNQSDSITLYPNLTLGLSSRTLQAWENAPDSALNQITNGTPPTAGPLTYRPHWYSFGPHRFELIVTTPGGSQITTVEKVVWFLPIKAIIIVTLIAIITITLIVSAKKGNSHLPNSHS